MIQLQGGDIGHAHACTVKYCQDALTGHFLGFVTSTSPVTVTVTATDAPM